jgi:prepilin-type N-terminal cleavage/methylation domain-containing protein
MEGLYPRLAIGSASARGFTILELSLVLTIIALITSMGIVSSLGIMESAKRTSTEQKIDAIEKALMTFRLTKNRLPCPAVFTHPVTDTNYGLEADNPGSCTGVALNQVTESTAAPVKVEGAVPVRSLNLPDEYMYDAWGRKFSYGVQANATAYDAFSLVMPNESCSITVQAASGTRTSGAVYALVSHGPNGHGGYLSTGVRMNAGSTNASELANCDCTNTAADGVYNGTYVQQDVTESTTVTNIFDDIVRYRERWQLQSADDHQSFTGYKGGHLIVGFAGGALVRSAWVYQHACGTWNYQTDLLSTGTAPIVNTAVVGFTPNNQHLVAYSRNGCGLYKINSDGSYTKLAASAFPNCPTTYATYNATLKMAMSNNGYMVMISTVAPYIWFWKLTGDSFVSLSLATTLNPPSTVLPLAPTFISLTRDASYMVLATATSVVLYKRQGDIFSQVSATFTSMPVANITGLALSPDGRYLAVGEQADPPKLYVWDISGIVHGSTVATVYNAGIAADFDNPTALTFSPDGNYLVMGGGNKVSGNDNIVIYKIDTGNTFTKLADPLDWVSQAIRAGTAFAFSPDSRYIAMLTADSTLPLAIFSRNSSTYQYYTQTITVPAYSGSSVAFHR